MLFLKQPGFCSNCGKADDYEILVSKPCICSKECWSVWNTKYTMYIMGKKRYEPEDK